MSSQIDNLISVASDEVGYLEKKNNTQLDGKTENAGSNNYTKYGAWYGLNGSSAYWCHMFVSWCANQAGISTSVIPKTASCGTGVAWFKNKGRWHARSGYTPIVGDIVYFTENGGTSPAHVGIVCDVSGGKVYTIEGNTSGGSTVVSNGGGVAKKSYALTYNQILGYGHPDYADDMLAATNHEEEEQMDTATFRKMYQDMVAEDAKQPASTWPNDEFDKAKAAGITDGTSPKAPATREQVAVMVYRATKK